ncbi:hypothetical protein CHELA1G11_12087 [Hyphomicrobiales bacterium]|nr:hypothetical protein CHELA1G11_12087 [Hyphomicrobiales bacterium]CAH1663394.1 hypothetical protein CHELA1G2_12226 [Hyphomicrobiales bacterium]
MTKSGALGQAAPRFDKSLLDPNFAPLSQSAKEWARPTRDFIPVITYSLPPASNLYCVYIILYDRRNDTLEAP